MTNTIRSAVRICAAALSVVGASAVVSAQQMLPEEPNRAAIKFQVKNFEGLLKNAVDLGGQQVADRARQVLPTIALVRSSDPIIKGWAQPEWGFMFEVEVPDILNYGSWQVMARQNQRVVPLVPVPSGTPPASGTSQGQLVSGAGGPPPDPMQNSPVIQANAPLFDPVVEYRDRVRDALIEAILENSGGLPFKETDWLGVIATNTPVAQLNPLNPDPRKLGLQIRASDLMKYRRKEITREEAQKRILEWRF